MHQLLRILARAAVIVVIASLFPAKLHARDLWIDASYAKPLRWNVGAFLFYPSAGRIALQESDETPGRRPDWQTAGTRTTDRAPAS